MNNKIQTRTRLAAGTFLLASVLITSYSQAALVSDPDDARTWQGATVGTFAALYHGTDTLANRQLVVDDGLLDDSVFTFAGATAATLVATPWALAGAGRGESFDSTGTGSYDYGGTAADTFGAANVIDNKWIQSSGLIGDTVFDLGAASYGAVIFPVIDHGPLPQEAIESTVYLSDSPTGPWTEAVVERVWLEGFQPNTGIKWDGFSYAVGTGTSDTFRYASIIHGGPGALINDGDDEINGIVGINRDFTPSTVPDFGGTLALFGLSLGAMGWIRRQARNR